MCDLSVALFILLVLIFLLNLLDSYEALVVVCPQVVRLMCGFNKLCYKPFIDENDF